MWLYSQRKYLNEISCSSAAYKKLRLLWTEKGSIVVMSSSWQSQQNKFTSIGTFCFLELRKSAPGRGSDLDVLYILWASSWQIVYSAYSVVLDSYRICLTRTVTGTKPASTASSARIHWWTNLLLQKKNIYFVLIATPTNTLPNAMSARRLLCQVRMLTFWAKKR